MQGSLVVWSLVTGGFALAYSSLLFYLTWGFYGFRSRVDTSVNSEETSISYSPQTFFSVVICARNEEAHIEQTLQDLLAQDFSKNQFEILVVNDASTDRTGAILEQYKNKIQVIHLEEDFGGDPDLRAKKRALNSGINASKGDWIVCSDADCRIPIHWLSKYASMIGSSSNRLILGPVLIDHPKSVLDYFQELDFLGLMGLTEMGIQHGFYLANGANMAFEKSLYKELKGFQGSASQELGEDLFWVRKVSEIYPSRIGFASFPYVPVYTKAMPKVRDLLKQRIRWASATPSSGDSRLLLISAGTFGLNLCLLTGLAAGFLNVLFWLPLGIFLLIKVFVDYIYLRKLANRYGLKGWTRFFVPSFFIQLLYFPLVGMLALLPGSVSWKDRVHHFL